MNPYRPAVHKSNSDIIGAIRRVRDENGRGFNQNVWSLIELIARFPRDRGCYMTPAKMVASMGGEVSERTVKRNLKYLAAQGVITKFYAQVHGRRLCVRRVAIPANGRVESLVSYRKRTGEYRYEMGENSDLFFKNRSDKMVAPGVTNGGDKSPPNSKYRKLNGMIKNPYNPLFTENEKSEDSERRPADAAWADIRRPNTGRLRAHERGDDFSFLTTEEKDMAPEDGPEPLVPKRKKRKPKPKTQRERKIQAIERHNRGHIVNPLGGPDTNPKRLNWKKARDIGEKGTVTIPQLYRHLIMTYEDSIGTSSVIDQMPNYRHAVQAWFDDLRQRFLEVSGYTPSNRDLADYLSWLLDPKRFRKPKELADFKVQQIKGKIYIKQFYDLVLSRRNQDQLETVNPRVLKHRRILKDLDNAFDTINRTIASNRATLFCMSRFGFTITAQFLHERQGLSESQCRKRIIDLMADFLGEAGDTEKSVEFLSGIYGATEKMQYVYDSEFLWFDWESKCSDLIDVARRVAKENG